MDDTGVMITADSFRETTIIKKFFDKLNINEGIMEN